MKVLVTGCSGMLGSAICYLLQDKCSLLGSYHQTPPPKFIARTLCADLCDTSQVDEMLNRSDPDVLIHCASLTNVDLCEADYYKTRQVNVVATRNLVEHRGSNTFFIYISTDSVFDGGRGNYSETDLPSPLNNYAMTKLEGEWAVQQGFPNYLILRTNFFGFRSRANPSSAEWILYSLLNEKPIRMITDWYFSPIFAGDLAKIVSKLVQSDIRGLYHVAGGEKCSKYAFAVQLAQTFSCDKSLIEPASFRDFSFRARRPKDMSLNSAKVMKELKIELPSYGEGLQRFWALYSSGYLAKLEPKNTA